MAHGKLVVKKPIAREQETLLVVRCTALEHGYSAVETG